ncbi:MAG: biotin--[acetyl-CoA-carboxylase] ligase, partial [Geminicoccaceae bacterium]
EVASLSLVVALSLAEALDELSGGRLTPQLKWPNDVLVDGAKLAGILLELMADPRRDMTGLIVGLGVNVGWAPGGDLPYPATSLAERGLAVSPRKVLVALAGPLRARLDRWETSGFTAQREDWLARAAGRGGPVEARIGDRIVRGRLVDLEPGGAVCVERADGGRETVSAGELVIGGANGLALPILDR